MAPASRPPTAAARIHQSRPQRSAPETGTRSGGRRPQQGENIAVDRLPSSYGEPAQSGRQRVTIVDGHAFKDNSYRVSAMAADSVDEFAAGLGERQHQIPSILRSIPTIQQPRCDQPIHCS